MKYFASWTHSDPLYQDFLPDTCLLVSPPSVNQVWQAVTWPIMPTALMIDSGAFQFMPGKYTRISVFLPAHGFQRYG
jgi:hypothetical protein